jgi:hypothetical protein
MSMENMQVPESASIPPTKEYRILGGKIEARILGDGSAREADWTEVSSEQLSSHVQCNTAVARWLERNMGWRRLLRACVGQEPAEEPRDGRSGARSLGLQIDCLEESR